MLVSEVILSEGIRRQLLNMKAKKVNLVSLGHRAMESATAPPPQKMPENYHLQISARSGRSDEPDSISRDYACSAVQS